MTKLMFCQPLHCLPSITKVVRKKYNKAAIEYGLELCRYPNRFHFFLFFSFFLAPNSPLVATVIALLMLSVDIHREAGADPGFFLGGCAPQYSTMDLRNCLVT